MHQSIIKVNYIIILTLVNGILTYDFNNLDNLGQQISDSVNRGLAPLQNLGSRISQEVNEGLRPIRTGNAFRGAYYNSYPSVNVRLPDMDNLGERISSNVRSNLAPLNNLGQQIEQSVYQSLEPVRAMELTFKMKDGVGGTTIATHSPGGKKFILHNGAIYECFGIIQEDNGKCSGNLVPFQVKDKKDYCYRKNGYSIINDHICIGASSVSVINNEITCVSNTNTPALLIKVSEYNSLCKEISNQVEYKYIANPSDPAHVKIPNENKYVKCKNNQPGVCIFTESHSLPYYSGSNIIINNGQSQSIYYDDE